MKRIAFVPATCLVAFVLAAAGAPPPPPPTAVPQSSPRVATPVKTEIGAAKPARPVPRARKYKRAGAVAHVAAANRAATLEPAARSFINAAQIYPWSEGVLYHVYTAPGRVTDIMLQPGETLGAVASGDTVRWVIGDTTSGAGEDKRTHILVKPFAAGLATNLVVTTDRRTYHLALTSTGATAMAALSWTYPQDALLSLKRAQSEAEAQAPVASGLALEGLHFDYAITGDSPAWRPLRAFDDGRQTFIEFAPSIAVGEAPPLFIVDAKGEAHLVNYRMQGRFYVVDRLFDAAELRLGTKKQDIVRISRTEPAKPKRRGRAG